MRKSRFTETQIVKTLKQVEGGRTVKEVCRELGISEATYFNWFDRSITPKPLIMGGPD
jgi:putative transposase